MSTALRSHDRGITPAIRARILGPIDDRKWCTYCGVPATEVDHIVPRSRGGGLDDDNLTPACFECNNQKRDSTPAEWGASRVADGKPWPIPSIEARVAFLVRSGGRPRMARGAKGRTVITNYGQFRNLLMAARDCTDAELLALDGAAVTEPTPVTRESLSQLSMFSEAAA